MVTMMMIMMAMTIIMMMMAKMMLVETSQADTGNSALFLSPVQGWPRPGPWKWSWSSWVMIKAVAFFNDHKDDDCDRELPWRCLSSSLLPDPKVCCPEPVDEKVLIGLDAPRKPGRLPFTFLEQNIFLIQKILIDCHGLVVHSYSSSRIGSRILKLIFALKMIIEEEVALLECIMGGVLGSFSDWWSHCRSDCLYIPP